MKPITSWLCCSAILISVCGCRFEPRPAVTNQSSTAAAEPIQVGEKSDQLRFLAWNVESEGNDPDVISDQLQKFDGYHVYALSEVLKYNVRRYADAAGNGEGSLFRFVNSQTGRTDRLEIIYDSSRLELLKYSELFVFEDSRLNDWRHRSPLVAHFRDRQTSLEFLLMVNHLARGDEQLRTKQAEGLRKWAAKQTLPVICLGDFNFDFQFSTQTGNAGFDAFLKDETFKWIRPKKWIDTNWADWDEDGKDDYPGSMLDFAFVAGAAKNWEAEFNVIVRRRDFPDSFFTSDHRPIELLITPQK